MHDIYQMLLATFAVVGQEMPDIAIKAMAQDLSAYEIDSLAVALQRCRRELRKITLADIVERIPGEHIGPEEAWAKVSPTIDNERLSVAMTQPMLTAYGVVSKMGKDKVAARVAFKEVYMREVSKARAEGFRPHWITSFGTDETGRIECQQEAEKLNLLAAKAMPSLPAPDLKAIPEKKAKLANAW